MRLVTSLAKVEHILETRRQRSSIQQTLGKRKRKANNSNHRNDDAQVESKHQSPNNTSTLASMTREQVVYVSSLLFRRIFAVPGHLQRRTTANEITVVTTDGVGASWHMKRSARGVGGGGTKTRKKKQNPTPKRVNALEPNIDYGTHGVDTILTMPQDTLTVIAVDPGHATLINAIRYHNSIDRVTTSHRTLADAGLTTDGNPLQHVAERDKQRDRRQARARKLAHEGVTTFELKNTSWRDTNGTRTYLQKIQSQQQRHRMQPAIDTLAAASARIPSVVAYTAHIDAKMNTAVTFQRPMSTKARRRWRFELYQTGQRAAEKLVTDLLDGVSDRSKAVLAWGNGSFGPTSRGHASAPNKSLRKMFARHVAIVLVDEHLTSKRCSCCNSKVTGLRRSQNGESGKKKRYTVLRCDMCGGLWGRDMAASANIAAVLRHQMQHGDATRPVYLARGQQTNA